TAVIEDSERTNVGVRLEQLRACRPDPAVAVADDQEARVGLLDRALVRGPWFGFEDLDLVLGEQPPNQIAEHAPADHDNAWAFHLNPPAASLRPPHHRVHGSGGPSLGSAVGSRPVRSWIYSRPAVQRRDARISSSRWTDPAGRSSQDRFQR